VLATLTLAFSLGCGLVKELLPSSDELSFSHRQHVRAVGLTCAECHVWDESSTDPSLPARATCVRCHAEDEGAPSDRRVAALFDGENFRAAHAGRLPDEVRFAHGSHLAYGLDCCACHAAVANDEGTLAQRWPELRMDMDACLRCHAERRGPAEADCASCHAEIRAERPPPSHGESWLRYHGGVVRERSTERSVRCALCHQSSSCDACHRSEQPASHDNFWRRREHGLEASLDRQSCATCHDADSCQRCHEEERPLSHTGSFGAPRDRHCTSCHEPLRADSCGVCHAGTPSHELATPLPDDHVPSMNCRLCHGNGQPLPHVDNGQSCTSCHR
jgi:hypothetical protein